MKFPAAKQRKPQQGGASIKSYFDARSAAAKNVQPAAVEPANQPLVDHQQPQRQEQHHRPQPTRTAPPLPTAAPPLPVTRPSHTRMQQIRADTDQGDVLSQDQEANRVIWKDPSVCMPSPIGIPAPDVNLAKERLRREGRADDTTWVNPKAADFDLSGQEDVLLQNIMTSLDEQLVQGHTASQGIAMTGSPVAPNRRHSLQTPFTQKSKLKRAGGGSRFKSTPRTVRFSTSDGNQQQPLPPTSAAKGASEGPMSSKQKQRKRSRTEAQYKCLQALYEQIESQINSQGSPSPRRPESQKARLGGGWDAHVGVCDIARQQGLQPVFEEEGSDTTTVAEAMPTEAPPQTHKQTRQNNSFSFPPAGAVAGPDPAPHAGAGPSSTAADRHPDLPAVGKDASGWHCYANGMLPREAAAAYAAHNLAREAVGPQRQPPPVAAAPAAAAHGPNDIVDANLREARSVATKTPDRGALSLPPRPAPSSPSALLQRRHEAGRFVSASAPAAGVEPSTQAPLQPPLPLDDGEGGMAPASNSAPAGPIAAPDNRQKHAGSWEAHGFTDDDDFGPDVAEMLEQLEATALGEMNKKIDGGGGGGDACTAGMPIDRDAQVSGSAAAGVGALIHASTTRARAETPADGAGIAPAVPVAAANGANNDAKPCTNIEASVSPPSHRPYRYRIEQVWENCPAGNNSTETQLRLKNTFDNLEVIAHLQSPWNIGDYRQGDVVNLIVPKLDEFDGVMHCLLAHDREGLLIHMPDQLLAPTSIVDANKCTRRGVLKTMISSMGPVHPSAINGTIYHSLFEAALRKSLKTDADLEKAAVEAVAAKSKELLDAQVTDEAAIKYLRSTFHWTLQWVNQFIRQRPSPASRLSAGHVPGVQAGVHGHVERDVAIQDVLDIEEWVEAPKFGMKGQIDASVKVVLADPYSSQRNMQQQRRVMGAAGPFVSVPRGETVQAEAANATEEVVVMPLELKTGKPREVHEAQLLLYLLLIEERYGPGNHWGLLVYNKFGKDPHSRLVGRNSLSLASLVASRNNLAAALAHGDLPPMTATRTSCNYCFERTTCALRHAVDAGVGTGVDLEAAATDFAGPCNVSETHAKLKLEYQNETGHMTAEDCAFLRKWSDLLDLEASSMRGSRGGTTDAAATAPPFSRCLPGLQLTRMASDEQLGGHLYSFTKPNQASLEYSFPLGDMVMLDVEDRFSGVTRAHVYEVSAFEVTIFAPKRLRHGILFPNNEQRQRPLGAATNASPCDPSLRWRIRKQDVESTIPRMRGYLYQLFTAVSPKDDDAAITREITARLRELIVRLQPPAPPAQLTPADATAIEAQSTALGLNTEQTDAVRAAVACRDYSLVLGMPGAGKTTCVAAMIRVLVARGKRVLLTSYTNSAVDNVLLKLAAAGDVPFLRIGRDDRIDPGLLPWTPGGAKYNAKTVAELEALVDAVPVMGTSALYATDPLVGRKMFDVCIVDEAGQITLPATLGPLLRARSFVLVGDPHQLPPLVTSKAADEAGLSTPLFQRLAQAHPGSVTALPVQYRMAEDIQALPNALVYDGKLRCGNEHVATQTLALKCFARGPASKEEEEEHEKEDASPRRACACATQPVGAIPGVVGADAATWLLQHVLDPTRRVVFLDTTHVFARFQETAHEDVVCNEGEARLLLALAATLAVHGGLAQKALGVISPYNRQVNTVRRLMDAQGLREVECLTVDKAQGRDKECVLVSFVRANEERQPGKLLADVRRVNVALTRAKAKLVMVGHAATLKKLPLFEKLLDECQKRKWVVDVSPLVVA